MKKGSASLPGRMSSGKTGTTKTDSRFCDRLLRDTSESRRAEPALRNWCGVGEARPTRLRSVICERSGAGCPG